MNLLIKLIYLFSIIIASRNIIPNYVLDENLQRITLVASIYISCIIYRIFINYYYKHSDSVKTIMTEALTRTLFVVVGMIVTNYLMENPTILSNYGINLPSSNIYTDTALSLLPLLLGKALLSPDI
jgi:hypothetical protein